MQKNPKKTSGVSGTLGTQGTSGISGAYGASGEVSGEQNKKYTVAFYTLGCRVNQYESRAAEEVFAAKGFEIRNFDEPCDVYVINTCTVTAESDRKSRQMIRRARRTGGKKAVVLAMGCMVQTAPDDAYKMPELDFAVGNRDKMSLAEAALNILGGAFPERKVKVNPSESFACMENMNITGADNSRAFLKICDGCDNSCSYCVIPKARGPVFSKKPEEVCSEVAALSGAGLREVVLTGIETAAYGKDTKNENLISLLEKVDSLDTGILRIRMGSLEPTVIRDESRVKRLGLLGKLMPHYHLSLQSGCDNVLAAMKRKYNTRMFFDIVRSLRRNIPDVTVTTDIIVGFPGETDEMFKETLDFVRKCRFLYIHIFPYSDRAGTQASEMDGKLDEQTKKRRAAELKKVMLCSRREVLAGFVGTSRRVLVEKIENGKAFGYTDNYIETVTDVSVVENVQVNSLINVKILGISDDVSCANAEYVRTEVF